MTVLTMTISSLNETVQMSMQLIRRVMILNTTGAITTTVMTIMQAGTLTNKDANDSGMGDGNAVGGDIEDLNLSVGIIDE